MMCLVIVRVVLHAPKSRHAGFIKRHMITSAFRAQRRLGQSNFLRAAQWIERMVDDFPSAVVSHQPNGQHFARAAVMHQYAGNFSEFSGVSLYVSLRAIQPLLFTCE